MAEIAKAYVSLMVSAKGVGKQIDSQVGRDVESSGKRMGSRMGKSIVGPLAAAFGAVKVVDFFKDSVAEARESQKVGALTTNVIRATGGAAKVTASQVGDLATAISNKTGMDDETIQSGANMLLTFKNIRNEAGKGNDVFNQSTKTLTDMAAAMGTEPKQAAIQLGKALNDPIKGISALSRVGVTFTEGQKKQIEGMVAAGNTMDAQKVILKELRSEFGGAAAAQSTAGEKAAVAFGNLKEQIGTALLPIIDRLAGTMTNTVVPAISMFISGMQSGAGAGGQFAGVVKAIGSNVVAVGGFLNEHRAILVGVVSGYVAWKVATLGMAAAQGVSLALLMAQTPGTAAYAIAQGAAAAASGVWTAAQWLLNVALTANPIGIVVVAIGALVAAVVLAWKNSQTFRNVVTGAWKAVASAVSTAVSTVVKFVKSHWPLLLAIVTGPMGLIVLAIVKNWNAIKSATSSAWDAVSSTVSKGVSSVVGLVKSIPGKILSALGKLDNLLLGAGKAVIQGLIDGISAMFGNLKSKLTDVTNFIKDHKGPIEKDRVLLEPAGRAIMDGLNIGLEKGIPGLKSMLAKITTVFEDKKSELSTLMDEFASISSSVADRFKTDLFGGSLDDLFTNGVDSVANLQKVTEAFKKLRKKGAGSGFLHALFESGNSDLITALAGDSRASVAGAQSIFNQQTRLANQLGDMTAQNTLGPDVRGVRQEIKELRKDVRLIGSDLAQALNKTSANAQRKKAA